MKFLLFGFGSIGQRHFNNVNRLTADRARWTVVEPNRSLWVNAERANFAADLAVVAGRFDAAMICSPSHLHISQSGAMLDRASALFIEKPLSHSMPGVAEFVDAAAERQLPTMVGCNFRFEKGLGVTRDLLAQGAIGRVIAVHAEFGYDLPSWRPGQDYRAGYSAHADKGGGVVLDRIHEVDYLSWLLGPIVEVKSFTGKLSTLTIDSEDIAKALLRFESGALGSVHLDYLQREYTCRLKVVGDAGTLEWAFRPSHVRVFTVAAGWTTHFEDRDPDVNEMYLVEVKYFLDCLATGKTPMNGPAEAAKTLAVSLAVRGGK